MGNVNFDAQVITGRKVFFVNPNITIFPEEFCQEFMVMGFECYFMMKDTAVPLEEKIDILFKSFKDIVLFFNIDAFDPKPGVSWLLFIKFLRTKYEGRLLVGIMYSKRPLKTEADKINFLYENEAQINCGAYMLEYEKKKNFSIMLEALEKIGARGRRKNVRVMCASNCKINFEYDKTSYFVSLTDLSLSHFSGVFDVGIFPIGTEEKIKRIEFNIKGTHFSHDATLLFRRPSEMNKELCVFTFTTKDGQPGLDSNVLDLLLTRLYGMLHENFTNLFMKIYDENTKKKLGDNFL